MNSFSATFRLTVLDPPARIFISAYDWLTIPGRGATFTYTWDGKDWNGNVAPKGIYKYEITARQTAVIETPNYYTFSHREMESDKSDWMIGLTSAEIIAYNEETDQATVRVGYNACPPLPPPPGAEWELSEVKVEVFDPDLQMIASASGPRSVCEPHYVDVNVSFDKSGYYVFLVSGKDNLYPELYPYIDKGHRIRPLLQDNSQIEHRKLAVMVDPGHGAVMNEGTKKHRGGNSTDPDGVFPVMYEADNVLDIAQRVKGKLSGKKHVTARELTRSDEWDIGPKDKTNATVGDPDRSEANRERVEKLKEFIAENYKHHVVFVSVHTNADGLETHGTGEVNIEHKTWLASYILAMLTCEDPTLTQLMFNGPWIQGNLVLNGIASIPNDPKRKLRPVPATLIEVAFHTNWRTCSNPAHGDHGCPRQPPNHWLEARRLRNDADSGNSNFLDRVATCFEDGCWFYWAIAVNELKERSWYDCLNNFTHWP